MLTAKAKDVLDTELGFLKQWPKSGNPRDLDIFLGQIVHHLKLKIFSPEYTLLLGLFSNGHMSGTELKDWSNLPHASFYIKLKRLISEGHVCDVGDSSDHRKARLALSDTTRQLISDVHGELEAWAGKLPA
ncbi:MarR family winged helix-turn-helix transcriptional regulator [Croceicoccus naphthovorans]|uniref:MarR family winged helix-turn-helix transcriptional regulator n=1 Tax=Croceicoccus naphthovorans TaxID=1348774 RepID=UPI001C8802D4|nr:MarR family winged helix-turn-helix transcriptional regulator [Croceicoccus naphthovorans]